MKRDENAASLADHICWLSGICFINLGCALQHMPPGTLDQGQLLKEDMDLNVYLRIILG